MDRQCGKQYNQCRRTRDDPAHNTQREQALKRERRSGRIADVVMVMRMHIRVRMRVHECAGSLGRIVVTVATPPVMSMEPCECLLGLRFGIMIGMIVVTVMMMV